MKKTALIVLLFLVFFLSLTTPLKAQTNDSTGLTISPPVRELELLPGSSNSYQVSLLNLSDKSVRATLRASPFTPIGNRGDIQVSDDELDPSRDWIIINPSILTLGPKERKKVDYTIVLPHNASPGGFYFAIAALVTGATQSKPTTPGAIESGSAVNFNVSSLNLIRIAGPVHYDALISSFTTPKKLYEYGPVPFTAVLKNTSNVHIKPLVEVVIRNTLGIKEKTTISLRQQNILPGAERRYETEYGGKWHFGRYVATLNASYGNSQSMSHTLIFWILPWKIMAAVLLAIVILLLLGYLVGHRKGQPEPIETTS